MYLFERLSLRPQGSDGRPEAFDEAAAIMAQIQRIVAMSRHVDTDAAAVPWGMPSVVEIGSNATAALERYAQRIAQAIARYEPRLMRVRVTVEAERAGDAAGYPNPPYRLVVSAIFPGESQARSLYLAVPG